MRLLRRILNVHPQYHGPQSETRRHAMRGEQFVPDDERVVRHLEEVDGFVWQGELVGVLGWTEAKTSRTLSEMERHGLVTRYRIGRRKVVCLPHQEPEIIRQNRLEMASP